LGNADKNLFRHVDFFAVNDEMRNKLYRYL